MLPISPSLGFETSNKISVALSEYPHIDVEVYEGASQLGEIGAGFGLFPRESPDIVFERSN